MIDYPPTLNTLERASQAARDAAARCDGLGDYLLANGRRHPNTALALLLTLRDLEIATESVRQLMENA